jgi:sensor histidine kinase YesM
MKGIGLHISVWLLLWVFLYAGEVRLSYNFAVWNSLMVVLTQSTIFYCNIYWKNKAKKGESIYKTKTIGLLVLLTGINLSMEYATKIRQHFGIFENGNDWYTLFSITIFVVFNMCAYLASEFYINQKEVQNYRIQIQKLKEEKMASELSFLRSKMNPHFLFNSLNTIYTMSYLNDSRSPEKIMLLSEMLRYVLYDCNAEEVSLKREVDYLKAYIDFKHLRGKSVRNITFDEENGDEFNSYKIAPMLLLPFVENAYKHSHISSEKEGYIKIAANLCKGVFFFSVENSVPDYIKENNALITSGIGLKNVRKRLEIQYQKRYYSLNVIPGINKYRIEFTLKLDRND